MLQQFSERVVKRLGATPFDWVAIATMIAEMISACLNKPSALKDAIESPGPFQRIGLALRCRQEFGWRDGGSVARAILDEAKPFRDEQSKGLPQGQSFEEALLAEVAEL